jgi:hypothetical protein
MSEHFPDEPVSAFTVAHVILLSATAIALATGIVVLLAITIRPMVAP